MSFNARWQLAKSLFFAFALLAPVSLFMPRALAFVPGLAAMVIYIAYGRPRDWLDKRIFYPLLILGGLALFSAAWAIHPAYTLKKAATAIVVLLSSGLFASIALRVPAEEMRPYIVKLGKVMAVAALLLGLEMSLGFPFQQLLVHFGRMDRLSASHANRSVIAVLLLSLPVLCGMNNSKARLALLLALLFMMAHTASQSSQLAFGIAAVFALAFPYRSVWAWRGLAAVFVVLLFAAPFAVVYLFQHYSTDINSLPFLGDGQGFGAQRLEIWDFVSRYMFKHPVLGYGMEATRQITDFDSKQLYFENPTVLHPHNFALQLWIEFGVVGAVTGAALIVALYTQMGKYPMASRVALPGVMAVFTVASIGYGMWQGWWIGLVLAAAALNILFARLAASGTPVRE